MAPNVLVCMKQVPNPDLQFQVAAGGTDIRRDTLNYRTNGADEYALEEAVRLKEKHGGRVVALTAGPKRTEPMLREALAKGADEAVRVAYDDPSAFDAMKVARILAAAVKTIPHDLVLTGVQSDDHINSLTGGFLAATLGHPSGRGLAACGSVLLVVAAARREPQRQHEKRAEHAFAHRIHPFPAVCLIVGSVDDSGSSLTG